MGMELSSHLKVPPSRFHSGLPVHAAGQRGVLAAAHQPGAQQACAGPQLAAGGPCEADHARRTPHLNGGVVAGRQEQLLVGGAEGH